MFSCVVQLQLRAEEVQSQRQELELIRQRMIKLTGDGKTAGTLEVIWHIIQLSARLVTSTSVLDLLIAFVLLSVPL